MRTLTMTGVGAVAVLAAAGGWAGAKEPVEVGTRVVKATVYAEGAQVTREGKRSLPEGEVSLVIPGLPVTADPGSLRVTLRGPKGSLMHNVQLRTVLGAVEAEKRTRELRHRIRVLQDRRAVIQDRITARNDELAILRGTRRNGKPTDLPRDWKNLTDGAEALGNRIHELLAENRKDEVATRELDEQIGDLNRAVALSGSLQKDTLALDLDLGIQEAGEVTFTASYVVREASWRATYDLALAPESASESVESKLDLTLVGEVMQRTGEDWTDARLVVSTERPAYLAMPVPVREDYRQNYKTRRPAAIPMAADGRSSAAAAAMPEDRDDAIRFEGARIDTGVYATRFKVAHPVTVKTGSEYRRVAMLDTSLACKAAVVIVPSAGPTARLEAEAEFRGDQPLVPGRTQLYRDGEFVGTGAMPTVMPGEPLRVVFGADPAIRVTRKQVVRGREHGLGWFGSVTRRYRWETTLKSGHPSRWTVEVREQLPQVDDPDVHVSMGETPDGLLQDDPERPGLKRWKVDLEPGKMRTMVFEYLVKQKKGTPVRVAG